LAQSVW